MMDLKNKHVLITAGPTWVPIDRVRVLSNIASGETGIALSKKLAGLGAKVTLILGPVGRYRPMKKIRILHFKFLDELRNLLFSEIKTKRYDIVIHSAAVSDYKPSKVFAGKIKSNLRHWKISLVPASKLIDCIKKIDRSIFLIGFKFELGKSKTVLVNSARKLIEKADLDLVVANTSGNNRYRAYILGKNKDYGMTSSKEKMITKLSKLINEF